jgi:hypothetical protein
MHMHAFDDELSCTALLRNMFLKLQECIADIPKLTGGSAELIRDWIVNSIDAVFYWCDASLTPYPSKVSTVRIVIVCRSEVPPAH